MHTFFGSGSRLYILLRLCITTSIYQKTFYVLRHMLNTFFASISFNVILVPCGYYSKLP